MPGKNSKRIEPQRTDQKIQLVSDFCVANSSPMDKMYMGPASLLRSQYQSTNSDNFQRLDHFSACVIWRPLRKSFLEYTMERLPSPLTNRSEHTFVHNKFAVSPTWWPKWPFLSAGDHDKLKKIIPSRPTSFPRQKDEVRVQRSSTRPLGLVGHMHNTGAIRLHPLLAAARLGDLR